MGSDAALGGGGVLFTFIVNVVIATIIFLLLGTCIRRISPFVFSKKRKLFAKHLKKENMFVEETTQIPEEHEVRNLLQRF
jgi:hypothetical protein